MNKYRQCMYTVILILTCLVASPFIFKQIWDTSSAKKNKADKKEPKVIAAETTVPESEQPTTEAQESTEAEEKPTEEPATKAEPEKSDFHFGTSDASYFDDALFIGDSRTVGIKEYGYLKNADYFCSVGLSAYKIANEYVDGSTISDKLSSKEYGKIYVMLGINEVANDTEYTISAFRSLLETIREYQPDAVIYLEGNLHVTAAAQTENITNEGIDALNFKLSELADDNENVYFININEVFDDETGSLTPEFTSDGIHVLGKYYETWCDWFCANTVIYGDAPEAETTTETVTDTTEAESEEYAEEEQYYDNSGDTYESYDNYSGDGSYSDDGYYYGESDSYNNDPYNNEY
ncbi:MAG: hypothetical protein J5926_05385 [Ruminococcus sp.]|nr:hypothetical protein [Ruminococcus sp.]